MFTPFVEKDMGKQFRSLTDIQRLTVATESKEGWVDYQVLVRKLNSQWFSVAMLLSEEYKFPLFKKTHFFMQFRFLCRYFQRSCLG